MNKRESLLPKESCPYCNKIAWTWTIENGQNVARPHNPNNCFLKPTSPYYNTYSNYNRN